MMPLAQESMDPRPDPARQPENYPDPARQPANYMSAVARRNIDAPSAAVIAEETAASERQLEEHRKRRITTTQEYEDLAAAHGLSPAHLALAWCYSRSFVASTILGARHVAQLEDQLDALAAAAKVTPALARDVDRVHHCCPNPNYSDTHGQYYAT